METINKISNVLWELPQEGDMKVPGIIVASEKLLEKMKQDRTLKQLKNVATLPGIQKKALVMPDGHEGYGFPIGGVAALDAKEGGISPGGIGFDINCGVRAILTNFKEDELKPYLKQLVNVIFKNVPAGVGSKGKTKVDQNNLDDVLNLGVKWAIENDFGWEKDLKNIEEQGAFKGADTSKVSAEAKKRGMPQIGSLGSGNHFLEIQKVEEIYDEKVAKVFGINELNQVIVMIHSGSRGLGHQVCSDYIRTFEKSFKDIVAKLPDRELIYAPAGTQECEDYLAAMKAAANYAWTNRHMMMHWVRNSFEEVFKKSAEDLGMNLIYDVAHNIAKEESYKIDGKLRKVYVHRKGATRAFGPDNPELPIHYQKTGQPIIIPGSMGTASYILVGSKTAEEVTFSSTAHGAGRAMSRSEALKQYTYNSVNKEMESKGIIARSVTKGGLVEEAPGAYKDIDEVVKTSHEAGIGQLVVKLKPLAVIKG